MTIDPTSISAYAITCSYSFFLIRAAKLGKWLYWKTLEKIFVPLFATLRDAFKELHFLFSLGEQRNHVCQLILNATFQYSDFC